MKVEMSTSEVINLLLNKEIEIDNKITNTVSELLRLGYDSERGKEYIKILKVLSNIVLMKSKEF